MRRTSLLLGTTLLGVALAPVPQQPAAASCTAPYLLGTEDLVLDRGGRATIEGRSFVDGCRDSLGCGTGLGCNDCEYDDPPEVPMENVELRLVQDDRTWTVATADAGSAEDDQLGWVTWTFELPQGATPGRARLVADSIRPVRIEIR